MQKTLITFFALFIAIPQMYSQLKVNENGTVVIGENTDVSAHPILKVGNGSTQLLGANVYSHAQNNDSTREQIIQ